MVVHYLEIHPDERIVYAYTMDTAGRPISSSLVTVEFTARSTGSLTTYTEQAVFVTVEDEDIRESGTGIGFDRLIAVMQTEAAHVP